MACSTTKFNQSSTSTNDLFISLDIPRDPLRAHLWINAGVEPGILYQLVALIGSDINTVCHLVGISRNIVSRKLKMVTLLNSQQGARVYGVIQVLDAAISLHEGDLYMVMLWLNAPSKALGGEKPAKILTTAMGVQAIIDHVGRIKHGIIS
ncbi:antitoxin Xre/MbcA/ParS toxin-binding domain-containing protein [Aeromonas caviae]|uniref:antitoxin Xre/MbcA/ParS toxin-binding domain-containing protein n=1 Tax=Aeromonas caviae TaxID=648 RepID=UPI002B24789F|nr:antitoxin Xre/MbcA/ParS toxin-binding domain-containing protein [Aeromonas caviae]MEA9434099.1 antitoxin Xre/MbcA/ParS toxin-binding domain-containing protein [Aeromonas caviae]